MSAHTIHTLLDLTTIGPTSERVTEKREVLLAEETEELGALRFAIILTARWADSDSETLERRAELRSDLRLLRIRYSNKIDEIAMSFGVGQAMKAKDEVEQTVIVPRDYASSEASSDEREDVDDEYSV